MTDEQQKPEPMTEPAWLEDVMESPVEEIGGIPRWLWGDVRRSMLNAIARDRAERPQPALTLRSMDTAPRDGSFILIQHNINLTDRSDDAEITFSLCRWSNGWLYTLSGKRMYTLSEKYAHGWIPRPGQSQP